MAEEKKEEGAEAPKSKKKLVIIVAVVVLLVGGGVGAFLAKGSGEKKEDAALEEGAEEEGGHGEGGHGEGGTGPLPPAVLPLETFIVNLQVKGSFLRTTIQLEFAEPELPHTIESDVPKIKDTIIKVLSSKSSSELLAEEGKEKIKAEIRDGVNEVLGAEDVTNVWFTEFIIQ